jgi:hypothetical protein
VTNNSSRAHELDPVPGFVCLQQQLVECESALLLILVSFRTSDVKQPLKSMDIGILFEKGPVEPVVIVIKAIGVVCSPSASRRITSPISIIGMPSANVLTVIKFLTWRLRSFSMAGSSVGPSTPQFQLRLSLLPSRFSSRFTSFVSGRRRQHRSARNRRDK